jgi:hypothetical protein
VIPSLWWSVLACIRPLAPGPELGACAEIPDGVFRYGEAGIGTCLAGPADLSFFQQDGGTFLAVVNADPYRQFAAGSVLVIDWLELAEVLDDDPPRRIPMDGVTAFAFSGRDDDNGDGFGDNPFYGGFAYLPGPQVAVVPTRLSENGVLRTARDEAVLLDLSRMELAGDGIAAAGALRLEDDPQLAVADPETDRVYVGNLTDHSISVLTARVGADVALPLAEVDIARDAGTSDAEFVDLDGDGSLAEMTRLALGQREFLVEDDFLLDWIDASLRLFVPTPVEDSEVIGLVRWASGGGDYRPTAFGLEEFFDQTGLDGFGGTVHEPFVEVDEAGTTTMWFARDDGTIWRAAQNTLAGSWIAEAQPVRSGGLHRAPSAAPLDEGVGLYTERVPTQGGPSAVHLSVAPDGVTFSDEGIVLAPSGDQSFGAPFVVFDPAIGRYRMWLAIRSASGSVIGLSESEDGRRWSAPIQVLTVPGGVVEAPTVARLDGRYAMWTSLRDDAGWSHGYSWSWDGVSWTDPVVVATSEVPADTERPPRAGVIAQLAGAWRVSSETGGSVGSLLPAGLDEPVELVGLELSVANGHEFPNAILGSGRPATSVVPSSALRDGAETLVYATAYDAAGRGRIVVLSVDDPGTAEAGEPVPDWEVVADGSTLRDDLGLTPAETVTNPIAVRDDQGVVVFATLTDRDGARIVRLESADGLRFGRLDRTPVIRGQSDSGWDRAAQRGGSIEVRDGEVHLWYTGDDGSRQAIGVAVAPSVRDPFVREPGLGEDFAFGTGLPGSFDDTSVADPLVVRTGDVTHLYYAGFDGLSWHLGHATRNDRGTQFVRRVDPDSELSVSAMDGLERSFSALGVRAPVLLAQDAGGLVLLYAGVDGAGQRVGRARVPSSAPDLVFAAQRFPTSGDRITFSTTRGGPGAEVIELGQTTQWYATTGIGMSSIAHDPDRGFLYVTSKLQDDVYVVDVRDDSTSTFSDENVFDLETLARIDSGSLGGGFRDAILSPSRSLLYLTQRSPDALVAVDLDRITDDDSKAPVDQVVAGVIPLGSAGEDLGADSVAFIGGAGMALTDDERFLFVAHFRQNAVSVFDLDRGDIGEEIAWIPWVGENPVDVRISPDQRYAVVANYVGEVENNHAESTLAVLDIDPNSDRYLEVVTWLVNR